MLNYCILINHSVSSFLNSFVLNNHLQIFIWIFADLPIFFLPIFLISLWLFYNFKHIDKKENLLYIFYATFLWIFMNFIIQHFFYEQRPNTFITPILNHVPDNSFPSDHAVSSFAFLTVLYLFWYKKTFWVFLPFVLIMNFARIAWGLHWFFDVVVWALIWIFAAYFIYKIYRHKYIQNLNKFILKIASFLKL